jgi:DNA (cytosine-5)-methyltransferase 1
MTRLLDLFCGAGGAAMGYHRAGFDEIVGVDNRPQPHYPFEFVQADALEYLAAHGQEFEAIHASPPCQAFTDLKHMYNAKEHADLLTPTRAALIVLGKPYVIENVEGAPMQNYITLCGTAMGLGTDTAELRRHRRFEIVPHLLMLPPCAHGTKAAVIGVYGGHARDRRRTTNTQHFSTAERAVAMGIDWMNGNELSQAIPPAYTEYIGRHLLAALGAPV